jgi:hypothetical protein
LCGGCSLSALPALLLVIPGGLIYPIITAIILLGCCGFGLASFPPDNGLPQTAFHNPPERGARLWMLPASCRGFVGDSAYDLFRVAVGPRINWLSRAIHLAEEVSSLLTKLALEMESSSC